jgi:hypothetical protein
VVRLTDSTTEQLKNFRCWGYIMTGINKEKLRELLVGKKVVSVDFDWPLKDDECGEVKITTSDGVVVVALGQEMGEFYMWFSTEP